MINFWIGSLIGAMIFWLLADAVDHFAKNSAEKVVVWMGIELLSVYVLVVLLSSV